MCLCLCVCVCVCVCAEPGAFSAVCLCCLRSIIQRSDLPDNMPPNSSAVPAPCKYIGVSLSDDEMSIRILEQGRGTTPLLLRLKPSSRQREISSFCACWRIKFSASRKVSLHVCVSSWLLGLFLLLLYRSLLSSSLSTLHQSFLIALLARGPRLGLELWLCRAAARPALGVLRGKWHVKEWSLR